ncbi:hypothetical protein NHQ30_011241 [Ciborinia camelliae]|nr:hypothetical protein NHQ30_011241 [Ciborinia camelliae]
MYSQSLPNFEFVLAEPKTRRLLFEVLFSSYDANEILTITADPEAISTVLFCIYVLSSIYFLSAFQNAVVYKHKVLFGGSPTINAIALFLINYHAVYLHCLWDNLHRYLFNTILGLPYGTSFFYPVPQSPSEIFPRWVFPHQTSEGLDFWTKFLILLAGELIVFVIKSVLSRHEDRQQQQCHSQVPSEDNKVQVQAGMSKVVEEGCDNEDLDYLWPKYKEVVNRFSQGQPRDVAGVGRHLESLGSDTRNAVEEIRPNVSGIGYSPISPVHGNIKLFGPTNIENRWSLIEWRKWHAGMPRKLAQVDSDEVDEQGYDII